MSAVWFIVAIFLAASDLLLIVSIGRKVGWRWTVLWLLVAVLLGASLIRAARAELVRLSRSGDFERRGRAVLVRAAALGLAGVLLAIPGLLSDLAAVMLLLGPVRRRLAGKFPVDLFASKTYGKKGQGGPFPREIRDAEFEILRDSTPRPPEGGEDRGDPVK